MAHLRTIIDSLDRAAERTGAGFTFIAENGGETLVTFAELRRRAAGIAQALREGGLERGDHVALSLPDAAEFVPAFLGVLLAGGVAVPLSPPSGVGQLGGYLEQAGHLVAASRAPWLLTAPRLRSLLGTLYERAPGLRAMLTTGELTGDPDRLAVERPALEDVCFIQFTSGSTSRPKGVVLSYGNLAANSEAILREGLAAGEDDRGLSWLPLYHDMGLIGFILAPVHGRLPVTVLSPMTFLKRPATWIQLLSKHRATITYAPNFAYALAARRTRDRDLEGVDLSAVRVAGCGAEPIQAETLRAFARRFAAVGFREAAFVPSYGMAEATLAVSFAHGLETERLRADCLFDERRAQPVGPEDTDYVEIVCCGRAFSGHSIRVVDPESRKPLGDREVGEVLICGPSVTRGYFGHDSSPREDGDPEGWLATGDLGYLAEGRLFITGRRKDLIIVNGRNIYPQDLEWAATGVEGVREGKVAAFSLFDPALDRERVVLVVETRLREGLEELRARVRSEVFARTGLMVDEVKTVEAGVIPRTTSGKVQRQLARRLYETGELVRRRGEGRLALARRLLVSQWSHLKASLRAVAAR